jgi:hypothetical protein
MIAQFLDAVAGANEIHFTYACAGATVQGPGFAASANPNICAAMGQQQHDRREWAERIFGYVVAGGLLVPRMSLSVANFCFIRFSYTLVWWAFLLTK